jgi:hypothetical protein
MKHLLLILVVVVAGYAAWVLADKRERSVAVRHITKHGFRLGFIVLVLLILLFAATQLPSTSII